MSSVNELKSACNNEEQETIDSSHEINSWDELDIHTDILRGIFAYGFEKPSPIQQKAILPIINGKDIIAQAQSGTGKTAAFAIGALAIINLEINNTQILVLSPTRELTIQTGLVMSTMGSMMVNSKKEPLRVQTLFGGSAIEESSGFSSKNTPHIICGCPGRVTDMLRRA